MIILIFPRISPALSASASERCHRERRRAIRGADGDVRPLPLGRGSTWRPADRCGQADQCAYVRPSEGRGVGRGGRRVRERAWVVTQLGGRWGGLGRCAPPRRGDADPRRNTMPTSSAAHVYGHTLATLLDPWPHFGHTLATLWPHLFAPGCNKMLRIERIITESPSDQAVKQPLEYFLDLA